MAKELKGGTFNVLYGRDRETVKSEVEKLLAKHDLDFLCLQEAVDYYRTFNQIEGYTYIASKDTWSSMESTILVKDSLKQDKVKFFQYGDGWTTVRGGNHPPAGQSQVRVDGWLYVRSLHLPTPSAWKDGKIDDSVTPPERKDDLIASMKGLGRYFRWPCTTNGRIAAGDWNENPDTTGEFSPMWLQNKFDTVAVAADSRAGHGRIDWPMGKGVRFVRVFKDLDIREGSDHEPVIFTVKKSRV